MPPSANLSDMDSLIRVETPSSLDSNNNPPENLTCAETARGGAKELLNELCGVDSAAAAAGEERRGRYSLRPRALLRPQIADDVVDESSAEGGGDEREEAQASSEGGEGAAARRVGGGRRARRHAQPLSRYRRRTANARERERMREINAAFEALRRALPPEQPEQHQQHQQQHQQHQQQQGGGDKVTKIATLRLAIRYIAQLTRALGAVSSSAAPSTHLPEETQPQQQQALPPVSSLLTLTAGVGLAADDGPLTVPMPLCLTPPPGLDELCLEPR